MSAYSFWANAAHIALESIFTHKLRTLLTLIGIVIGVSSVVVVGALISGFNTYITERLTRLFGANHFTIMRTIGMEHLTQEEWERRNRRNKRLDWGDYYWLKEHCVSCKEVGVQVDTMVDLDHGGQRFFGARINGVTANMGDIEDKDIAEGRFFLDHEVDNASLVCVIGSDVREKFFAGTDPVDKRIKITGASFRIVGVERKRGSFLGVLLDNQIYVPVTAFEKIFGRRQSLQIHANSYSRGDLDAAIEEARVSLRNHRKLKAGELDDFGIVNVEQVNNQVDRFAGAVAVVVTPITLISLIVGGIVVMNMMLVSVTERTFEIGLRKAVGARRRHIFLQFLIESCALTLFGGVLGLLLAWITTVLIGVTTSLTATVTIGYALMAFAVSGAIGVVSGLYPAVKAARLTPINALAKS